MYGNCMKNGRKTSINCIQVRRRILIYIYVLFMHLADTFILILTLDLRNALIRFMHSLKIKPMSMTLIVTCSIYIILYY